MPYQEKNAWAFLVIAVVAYAVYVAVVLSRAAGAPLVEVDYAPALLWTVGGAIVAGILAGIIVSIGSPKPAERTDRRDKQIAWFGERVGQSFLVIGGVVALLLALVEADYFWIANVVYLAFVLSAVVGSVAKLVAYRVGMPEW
ncbi:hypothetical protein ACFVWR_15825 [Leifsonia sp. NPDC058292]|uniref:hypothetical protein n=1 Tax=Leifsonia sp. NPDC058292 TaxID=3346428 RepID=UPI0036D8DB01